MNGSQYLEDLAAGYWFSRVLFEAVEKEIFTFLESGGKTAEEIAGELEWDGQAAQRFLHALCAVGLLVAEGPVFFNTELSQKYLVRGKKYYQGDSILWRKNLASPWDSLGECLRTGGRIDFPLAGEDPERLAERTRRYIKAMDNVARCKAGEITSLFQSISPPGELLDVGTGSGALAAEFLEFFPSARAHLLDLSHVLQYTSEFMRERNLQERTTLCPANILEPWPVEEKYFDLVILSNIIHAYSEEEISGILDQALKCLKPGGFMIIHDFFFEHCPEKAALFDLNMLVNTYNGKVFSGDWVNKKLKKMGFSTTGMIPLQTDTAVIIAST
ncbi:MAG: methyltransferase domain-containing protein [Clostridiales bacterium]|nr:methyltransferase domain-containing protein [Clostridiales bacterium]MCF8023586.1 methyltransferase domain-containing protein [Clostridiales bacterium]